MTFEDIYNQNKDLVYNLSLNYLQNIEDAEECTQDVFIKVHTKIEQFREESSHQTWIYRITINTCLDYIRKRKQKKNWWLKVTGIFTEQSSYLSHNIINHPGISLEQKEATEDIFRCINELPENQKTVIILSKLEGKSQKEIASIMNKGIKAVESLMSRGKSNLEQKLSISRRNKEINTSK